ncbi:hypothetical protein PVK06_022700 [Gossypium arboreum]|uniref:Uncharacterized protein n=1 Tax=Gossypium arboreum TaxID=29729 RepID=A0ABR0P971_GOSAR|nr:hypothetical protein PVK06_022700 [Gossypium arboreum]
MQSFISGIIRLGQRQGFCRWNSAHFKASTRAFLPTQSSNSLIHETNDSISSENHLLQLLGTRIGSQTKELMSPSSSGGCLIPSLSRLAAMMSSSSSRYMTTAASPTMDSSESVTDVPTRIKFKRLDKTARHIMQEIWFMYLQIVDKEAVEEVKGQREIPEIKPGYIVQLKVEVPENKRRVSTIKGIVIARRNAGLNTTFRIRRMVAGVGVESLFPLAVLLYDFIAARGVSQSVNNEGFCASSIATGLDQAPFLLAVGGGRVPPLQGGVISPIGGAVSRSAGRQQPFRRFDVHPAKAHHLTNNRNLGMDHLPFVKYADPSLYISGEPCETA